MSGPHVFNGKGSDCADILNPSRRTRKPPRRRRRFSTKTAGDMRGARKEGKAMERNRSQPGRSARRARFGREAKEETDTAINGAWAGASASTAWAKSKRGEGTRTGVRAAARAGAGVGAPRRDWVPLIDAATTRVVPLGFIFYLLATTLYLFYWGQPLGATEMWARTLLWNVWPWLGLMCLALTWAWASRKDPRHTWLRRLMNRAPLFGKKAAILGAALGLMFLLQAAANDVELALDLQAGPQGETGVVCTEFKEWPSYKNGDAKTTFVLRHANGRDETFEFTSRLGVWDDGPRGSIKRLCSSQESFTLWRWARTGVIADVE